MAIAETAETAKFPVQRARFLDRRTPPHIITLVLIAGLGAMNMNVLLPSLPSIAEYYVADYALVQLAISGYLAMTALLQLITGPLSDRFGRRPVLIGSIVIFILASIAAANAPTIETFLAARMVQATVVTGFALSRAIVRDMVPLEKAASMIGYVTMGMTLVPMVGPAVGGILEEWAGWQATFYFLTGLGAVVLLIVFLDLRETNLQQSSSFADQFHDYPELLKSRRFWGFAASAMFASGTFFAFLGGAPFVANVFLNLTPSILGLYFMFIAIGYMAGNLLSGRYATRFGIFTMMIAGNLAAAFGIVVVLMSFLVGFETAAGFFMPLFFVGLGNGLTLPSAMAGIVSVRPHLAGSAAGLGGAVQIGGGAALSMIAGYLLSVETGPWPLLWLMLASSVLGLASTFYTRSVNRQMEKCGKGL